MRAKFGKADHEKERKWEKVGESEAGLSPLNANTFQLGDGLSPGMEIWKLYLRLENIKTITLYTQLGYSIT